MGEHKLNKRVPDDRYSSAWQAHRDNACVMGCFYCIKSNKERSLSWRFIPADKYALFRKQEQAKKEQEPQRFQGGRVLHPDQGRIIQPAGRMIQTARRSG